MKTFNYNQLSEQGKSNAIKNYAEFMLETGGGECDNEEVKEIIIANDEQFNEEGELA